MHPRPAHAVASPCLGTAGFMRIVTSENTGPAGTANNAIERECAFGMVDRFAQE